MEGLSSFSIHSNRSSVTLGPPCIISLCPQPLQKCLPLVHAQSVFIHLADTPSFRDPQAGCAIDFATKLFHLLILLSEIMVTYNENLERGKYVCGSWRTCVMMKGNSFEINIFVAALES